jgi:hypothetical protein
MSAQRRLPTALKCSIVFGIMLLWMIARPAPAPAIIMADAMTMDYQVQNSDVILRGTCMDADTTFSNKHFITTYKIAVKKYLKAPGKMSPASDPVVFVSQLGGRVSRPLPVQETYPEMVTIAPGEEMVLFLRSPNSIPAGVRAKYDQYVRQGVLKPSPLMTNYQLTTLYISKLNVMTDPATGAEAVVRIMSLGFGPTLSPEAVKMSARLYQAQTASGAVKPLKSSTPSAPPVPPLRPAVTFEEKVHQMQNYRAGWSDFEKQVAELCSVPGKSSLPDGKVPSPAPTKTAEPRNEK